MRCAGGALSLPPFDSPAEEPDVLRGDLRGGGEFVLTTSTGPAHRWELRKAVVVVLPGWADPEPDDLCMVAREPDWLRTGLVLACTASSLKLQRHFRLGPPSYCHLFRCGHDLYYPAHPVIGYVCQTTATHARVQRRGARSRDRGGPPDIP